MNTSLYLFYYIRYHEKQLFSSFHRKYDEDFTELSHEKLSFRNVFVCRKKAVL